MKKNLTIGAIILGFIILGTAIVTGSGQDTAGKLLDRQIALENQIKILKVELDEVIKKKQELYVSGINEGVEKVFHSVAEQPQEKLLLEKPSQAMTLTR